MVGIIEDLYENVGEKTAVLFEEKLNAKRPCWRPLPATENCRRMGEKTIKPTAELFLYIWPNMKKKHV